ncbi:MAG: hypothetical protein KDC02_24100, partial [Flavobacteriales bacterium]|nr:hypothetical protein [Flavobacteriales bacterium]
MKPALLRHLRQLRRLAPAWEKHAAVDRVEGFLKRVPERRQRTQDGRLCTHFLDGSKPFAEALQEAAGDLVQGWDLEVIAPFFDQAETCRPLEALLEALRPRKVRLMLPLDAEGQALVDERIHADCASWQDVEWALLPDDLRMARKDIPRYVHAKVYRFFNARDRREILYVGSANMTTAAHQRGNLECGFLVETEPDRRPTWWTEPLEREPQRFEARSGSGEAATGRGSLLAVRYHWDRGLAEVFWMGSAASPRLVLSANGTHLADLAPVDPGSWQAAPAGLSERLRRLLPTTSLLQVSGEQEEELPILVMEEGMSHKPSLLRELTAEQILQYWA